MGAFAYTVAKAASATYGIRWLLVSALSGLSAADWDGESSVTIAGFDMPLTQSGSFTTLGPDGSSGVVVDPSSATSKFLFTPTIAALASHYSITTSVHDEWLLILSWTGATLAGNISLIKVKMLNSDGSHGWLVDYIQAGGLKFRVNNTIDQTFSSAIAGVETVAALTTGRGLFLDARYKVGQSLDWSDLTAAGFAENSTSAMAGGGGTAPATSVSAASASVTLTKFEMGPELTAATDGATLTGLAIGWIPGPGDSQA